jgi:NAD(P)-dependent dehydrogenase (short-subunit alcohol dehydrogenase family)
MTGGGPTAMPRTVIARGVTTHSELAGGPRRAEMRFSCPVLTREVGGCDEPGTGKEPEKMLKDKVAVIHPRRLMTLEEIANVAVLMASDKASWMTGNYCRLDHGKPG